MATFTGDVHPVGRSLHEAAVGLLRASGHIVEEPSIATGFCVTIDGHEITPDRWDRIIDSMELDILDHIRDMLGPEIFLRHDEA